MNYDDTVRGYVYFTAVMDAINQGQFPLGYILVLVRSI